MSNSPNNSIESRALKLLGSGATPEQTAAALGVTASRISQLISDPEFSAGVAELRFQSLSRSNDIDSKYDEMESTLQKRLGDMLCWMTKPGEILAAIRIINAAKRRGSSTPSELTSIGTVVVLNMPTHVTQQFTVNTTNQVIRAGDKDLVTVQSSRMKDLLLQHNTVQNARMSHDVPISQS